MSWLPKREKLDPVQASAVDFAGAQAGSLSACRARPGRGRLSCRGMDAAKCREGAQRLKACCHGLIDTAKLSARFTAAADLMHLLLPCWGNRPQTSSLPRTWTEAARPRLTSGALDMQGTRP